MDKIKIALEFLPKKIRNSFSSIHFFSKNDPDPLVKYVAESPMSVNIVLGTLNIVRDHDFFKGCDVRDIIHIIIHEEGHLKISPVLQSIVNKDLETANAVINNMSITRFLLEYVYNFDVDSYNSARFKVYGELMTKLDWYMSLLVKSKIDKILTQARYFDEGQIQNAKAKQIRKYLKNHSLTFSDERVVGIYEILKDEFKNEMPSCALICPLAGRCDGKCKLGQQDNDGTKIPVSCPRGSQDQQNEQQRDRDQGDQGSQENQEKDQHTEQHKKDNERNSNKSDNTQEKEHNQRNNNDQKHQNGFKEELNTKIEILASHGNLEDAPKEEIEIEENTITRELTMGERENLKTMIEKEQRQGGSTIGSFEHSTSSKKIQKALNAMKILEKLKDSLHGVNIPKKWMRGNGDPYDTGNMLDFSEISDLLSISDLDLLDESKGLFEPQVLMRHHEEGKRKMVIARDRSGSMNEGKRHEFANSGSIAILELVSKHKIEVAYVEFNASTKFYTVDGKYWTKKHGELMMMSVSCVNSGGTNIDLLLNDLMNKLGGEFDVILISDGEDRVQSITLHNLVKRDIRIFPVFIGGSGYKLLEELAKKTNGELFLVTKLDDGMMMIVDAVIKARS